MIELDGVQIMDRRASVISKFGGAVLRVAPVFGTAKEVLLLETEGKLGIVGWADEFGLSWVLGGALKLVGLSEERLREIV